MEWLTQLQGQHIGLDTAPLIYFIEQNQRYLEIVRNFFQGIEQGDFLVSTSTLTITEVLIHPLRAGNTQLAEDYLNILSDQENLVTWPVSTEIAELAARLRATWNLRTPDAIQIATAIQAGATFFFTNDARLPHIPEIEIMVLEELVNE